MTVYLIRRVLAMIPTMIGISVIVFIIINLAPGGPIEQRIQQIRFGGGSAEGGGGKGGSAGVSEEVMEALKKQYGFDKPMHVRYFLWLKNLATFDFGDSFTFEEPVTDVILRKFPVSLQFGIFSLLLSYLVSIPLGIAMATRENKAFDKVASFFLFVAYSVPPFMLSILMIVFLAGGSFLDLFPIGGISSENYSQLTLVGKIWDRFMHFILPLTAYTLASFTTLTLLMKNSILEEIKKDYVRTARAKGVLEKAVIFKHALRNALIPIATGLGSFLSVFFAGSLLIEQIFNLDGIGLLGYKAVLSRDYNLIMALVTMESFMFLLGNLLSDFIYVLVDPRIDFA